MSFSHAELGEDKIATTVTVPAACGLLRPEPMQTVPYAVFPQQPEILPFRRHGIRLRRGARVVASPEGLPSRELKKLETLDPLNVPLQHLSSAQPAAFSASQMNVPVREVSAARVELDDEPKQYTLAVNNWVEFDCLGAPSLETVFQEFTTLPPAFTFGAPPITLPDALKLQAQPIPPPQPQFALPAPLPLAALADLSDLSFDFLVLKY
jgi:hypothetical protein